MIDFIWLELPRQYIAMTRNNLNIISISLIAMSSGSKYNFNLIPFKEYIHNSSPLFAELRSAIQYAVMIKRRLPGYFWETYIPSLLLSTFGALSVYIPSDIVPGRMVLSMTSFLALIGLFGSARYV